MKSLDVGFLPVCENARLVGALTDITSCTPRHRPQPSKSKRDVIVTPTAVIETHTQLPRPKGIYWEYLTQNQIDSIPYLKQLRRPA